MAVKKEQQRAAAKASKKEDDKTSVSASGSSAWLSTALQFARRRPFLAAALVCAVAAIVVLTYPRQMRVLPIERVAQREMTKARFLSDFAQKKPVIITGAWHETGWMPEEVAGKCPHAKVRTHLYNESEKKWARHTQVGRVNLQEYFAEYFGPVAQRPDPLLYGFEIEMKWHCPMLLESLTIPSYLNEDAFHMVTNSSGLGWPSMLFGPEGTQTGIHIDTHRLPFWIGVTGAKGRDLKRFRIFPHDDKNLMKYGRPTESNNFHFDFNPWIPDYWSFPYLRDAVVYEEMMQSGDMLYIPGGSPHAVINHGDNLGVSMNYLDLTAFPEFVKKCNKGSPLCGVIQGKGAWVIEAMQKRRQSTKDMSYWEFAGVKDRENFCEVHQDAAIAAGEPLPAVFEYCPNARSAASADS